MDAYAGARDAHDSEKMLSPSTDRNKDFIITELQALLPPPSSSSSSSSSTTTTTSTLLLEVASGTGQHCGHFAAAFPHVRFRPSDLTTDAFGSVAAWSRGLPNVDAPIVHDCASTAAWEDLAIQTASGSGGGGVFDAIFVSNMCHISPYAATEGLFYGAGKLLAPGSSDGNDNDNRAAGKLIIYGPFTTGGTHTTESNAAFDASLRARDSAWGYRDVETDLKG